MRSAMKIRKSQDPLVGGWLVDAERIIGICPIGPYQVSVQNFREQTGDTCEPHLLRISLEGSWSYFQRTFEPLA